jgi:cytochrome c-type protein NapB
MNRLILPLALCAAPLLVAGPPPKPATDRDLGLSRTSVFEVPAPPRFQDETAGPGEKPLPRRINKEYPPVIPHGVSDFLPITLSSNLCLDCHGVAGKKVKGEVTPVPASHYMDYRRAPEQKGTKVAGTRYVCTACHVPRTDAPPAVGSTYRP